MSYESKLDSMALFLKCVFSPRLLRFHGIPGTQHAFSYVARGLEKHGDQAVRVMETTWKIGLYTSPILAFFLYKKNYETREVLPFLIRVAALWSTVYLCSLLVRAVGRYRTPQYEQFVRVLTNARNNPSSAQYKEALTRYDFEFWAWPTDFAWNDVERDDAKPRVFVKSHNYKRSSLDWIKGLPCQLAGYLVAHTFGIRMLYPGTIIQHLIAQESFIDGRASLIERNRAQRFKLLTQDGNHVDSVLVDRRNNSSYTNGDILVICSEGNAGFYEVGMLSTPLQAGYSTLGWNHPGFCGSTGMPYPDQELNAMDTVMRFAIHRLQFPPEKIVLYGWSIGGFASSWAAMNYPNIRALVLDATFDDVLPLALGVMPTSWGSLVKTTIRGYLNLNIAEQARKYAGPIILVRRVRDEVIAIERGGIETNRGNDLLVKILQSRFPKLVEESTIPVLKQWLSADLQRQRHLQAEYDIKEDIMVQRLKQYVSEHGNSFPMCIGASWNVREKQQLLLFLASEYMLDFDSTHCTPLPVHLFRFPREIGLESDFVEISPSELTTNSN